MPEYPTSQANGIKFKRVDSNLADKPGKNESYSKTELSSKGIKKKHQEIVDLLLPEPGDKDEQSEIIDTIFSYGSKVLSAQGSSKRNVLHVLIEDCLPGDAEDPPTKVREFLQRLIIEHPEVLSQRNDDGHTPLDKAARKGKPYFFLFMDHIVSDEKIKELKKGDWREGKRDPETTRYFERIARYFQKQETGDPKRTTSENHDLRSQGDTDTRTIDAKKTEQNLDNCPQGSFHHSEPSFKVQSSLDNDRLDHWTTTLHSCLESALSIGDNKSEKTSCLHILLGDEVPFAMPSPGASLDASRLIDNFRLLISMCPKSILETRDTHEGFTPLHYAVRLYQHDQIDYESINEIIRQLVKAAPQTIYSECEKRRDHEALTPYRLLKKTWDDYCRSRKADQLDPYWYNELEKFLKSAVIGDQRSRDEKIKHLYGGPKEAKRIFFDIPLVNEKVDGEYIRLLQQKVSLDFEAALEYVCLPEHDAEQSKHPSKQCDPYVKIFKWLAEDKKVEKIFKVVVDDMGPTPHSDDGIREALAKPIGPELKQDSKDLQSDRSNSLQSKFNIEVWDWRRLDICSETIAAVAPDVRELFLYSSGNPAVFTGWGCKYGLATLKKLQLVTIKVFSRRENDNACAEAFETFRKKFCRRSGISEDNVRIEYAHHSAMGQQLDKDSKPRGSDERIDPAWFQKLAPLKQFLEDNYSETATVKIALIDNGVDSAHDHLGNIKDGISFYGERNKKIPFRDFFTGPSEHGTEMAMCIQKVCPMAQLYVARLDDSMPNTEKLTVQSAVKSVRWATSMGVDIISMSWSFHKDDALDKTQLNDFEEAIAEAKAQKILLFGAMTDVQDKPNMADYFPLSLGDVIKIGSADHWSGKAKSGAGRISDYLFPGQNIVLQNKKGKEINVSGSSLATAFAAGLAGLVLFALKIHHHVNAENGGENERISLTNTVKTKDGMSRIFDVLGENPKGDKKDLYVGLGNIFPDTDKLRDHWSARPALAAFVGKICEKV